MDAESRQLDQPVKHARGTGSASETIAGETAASEMTATETVENEIAYSASSATVVSPSPGPVKSLALRSSRPLAFVTPLRSRFAPAAAGDPARPIRDLAAALDRRQPAGTELILSRGGRKANPPRPAVAPAAPSMPATPAKQSSDTEESDEAWYAKMRRYLAAQRGETPDPTPTAPEQPRPVSTESADDEAWYAKMRRYLATPAPAPAPPLASPPADDTVSQTPADSERASDPSAAAPASAPARSRFGGRLTVELQVGDDPGAGESTGFQSDQARLAAIAARGIEACERQLGPQLTAATRQIMPRIQVSIDRDLLRLSDAEAAAVCGQRLAEVIRSRLRRGIAEIGPSWVG